MSYVLNKTDGTVYATILDGTTNTATGITLIGRNLPSYGEIQNENFIRLLENFASTLPPGESVGFDPIAGTLWWDTANQTLKVYNGSNFIPVSQQTVSNTEPTIKHIGDQWFDKTTGQLKVWFDGAIGWQVIGPLATTAQGKTGLYIDSILDNTGTSHTVLTNYIKGNIASITSWHPGPFTAVTPGVTIYGFTTIEEGINIPSGSLFNGTAKNSQTVGGINPSLFVRNDQSNTITGDVRINSNLSVSGGNIAYANNSLRLVNTGYQGNVSVFINNAAGTIRPLHIEGVGGLVTVNRDPVTYYGVATKGYVDSVTNSVNTTIDSVRAQLTEAVNQVFTDYLGNIASTKADLQQSLDAANVVIARAKTDLQTAITSGLAAIDVVTNGLTTTVTAHTTAIALRANIADPTFTGTPRTTSLTNSSPADQIVPKGYVDGLVTTINTSIANSVGAAETRTNANITTAISGLAPKASPAFTGTVTAPTPTAGDSSTKVATTAFVQGQLQAFKLNYTVSASPPSGGNDGDFWFQLA